MNESNVLGQSKKGNFDPGLAKRINKEIEEKLRKQKLEAKKKKTEPKQAETKQPDKTAYLEKIIIDMDNINEHLSKLKENKEYVLENPGPIYVIRKEIKIPSTTKLTLEAGTELRLGPNVTITNYGTFEIKGTEQQKTILTAQKPKEGWNHIENHGYLLAEYAKISHGKGEFGGAISNMNKADIIDSEFENNHAMFGGAIYNDHNAELNITGESTFKNNQAKSGGAIRNFNGTVNIKGKNEFKNNQAKLGGAISWFGEKPEIDSRTIYDHNTPNDVSEDL